MKIICVLIITFSFGVLSFAQENSEKKNSTKSQTTFSKEKANKIKSIKNEKLKSYNQKNKIFGSALKSGSEIKLTKQSKHSEISNEELGKKLNNPKKLKK